MSKKIFFTFFTIILATLFWYALGAIFTLKDDGTNVSKLQCVSYAPFSKDGSPFDANYKVSKELVEKDLKLLSKYTNCIRTYGTVGFEIIPQIARQNNLHMLMGAWISKDEISTKKEIDTLIKLAKENQDVVKAVIVGNEVLLRGDASDVLLIKYINEVKNALPNTKVTYADVWEYWLKYPKIKDYTDFVTIHILPYWEDEPMGIHNAISHLANVRQEVGEILKDKDILIGETGWPSQGRMREEALPSNINQAKYIREFVQLAQEKNWNYNIIEAFDQPWKRISEGAVGGFWGLFDKNRDDKNVFKGEVSNFPNYQYLAFGTFLLILVFSTLLKSKEVSFKTLVLFSITNLIFAILYTLQVEQYRIVSRTTLEYIWAFLVLICTIFIYYYSLFAIINQKKNIPVSLFYISTFFVLVASIHLAFEGRYQNFEIYAFMISAISFLYHYRNHLENINLGKFEKTISLILILTSILILINETILNIYSNIWIFVSLIYAHILYQNSKIKISQLKDIVIYLLISFVIFFGLKTGFIANKDLAIQCNLDSSTLLCQIKDFIGAFLYFGYLGLIAMIFSILSLFSSKKVIGILALFFSLGAILLFNTFWGAVAILIAIYSFRR